MNLYAVKTSEQFEGLHSFGSRPPPNDGIWNYAQRAGFELHLEDRNIKNKEKKVDTGIATLLTRDAYKNGKPSEDVFVLVAGDADYVPTINELKADGYFVEVVFGIMHQKNSKRSLHAL